ncbi:protein kinase [Streptomyces adustus]|uniref:protein kinase domain-containing protein n=1 Tax=Streptomyces adustus TaxID=1609272 RepID=UPI0035DDF093
MTLSVLGEGGMGRAHLARRLPLEDWDRSRESAYQMADPDVPAIRESALAVVKAIRPILLADDNVDRVERTRARCVAEGDAIRTVVGPRIPAFLGASPEAAEPWLAVEYIPGPSLDTQVEMGGCITELGPWVALGFGLVEALESASGTDLLHRDLKPGNVVLGPDGPVVIDFGLAVLSERQDFSNALTQTGSRLGTPAFMPWEQYEDSKHVKASADVYAIGYAPVLQLPQRPRCGGQPRVRVRLAVRGRQHPERHRTPGPPVPAAPQAPRRAPAQLVTQLVPLCQHPAAHRRPRPPVHMIGEFPPAAPGFGPPIFEPATRRFSAEFKYPSDTLRRDTQARTSA